MTHMNPEQKILLMDYCQSKFTTISTLLCGAMKREMLPLVAGILLVFPRVFPLSLGFRVPSRAGRRPVAMLLVEVAVPLGGLDRAVIMVIWALVAHLASTTPASSSTVFWSGVPSSAHQPTSKGLFRLLLYHDFPKEFLGGPSPSVFKTQLIVYFLVFQISVSLLSITRSCVNCPNRYYQLLVGYSKFV